MPDLVFNTAIRLLEGPIDPIPRYRLLRDILQWPDSHPDLQQAYELAMQSRTVSELCQSQLPDGSWGRFYTRNKQVKNACKTTETALIRAFALGMDRNHPNLQKAIMYLESILTGKACWPDRRDQTLEWPIGIDLVTAARLGQIDPDNPAVIATVDQWKTILNAAFATPDFDEVLYEEAFENCFHQHPARGASLGLSGYILLLMRNRLPYDLEKRVVDHLLHHTRGIYLINNRSLQHLPFEFPSKESMRFIAALELLAYYPTAGDLLEKAAKWLWEQVNSEGVWDFGKFGRDGLELPLSKSWRKPWSREIDCTVRILGIMIRMQRSCDIKSTICHSL